MNIRYKCEHIVLRDLYAKNPMKVVSKLITEKGKFIYDLFLDVFEKNHEACPYQEKDYKVEIKSKDQVDFIEITMPNSFIEPTLCYKVILVYSVNLDLFQYFTVEAGHDDFFGDYQVLCAWYEDSHVTFTNIKEDTNIENSILDILMAN